MTQDGKRIYLVANWKSHKTLDEAKGFLQAMEKLMVPEGVRVIICPPFPYVLPMRDMVEKRKLPIRLGVQDVSPFPFGAYTGAVAAEMVKEMVGYAIVGHSERRKYFGESHQDVANKVDLALSAGLRAIVCVDEPYMEEQVVALGNRRLDKVLFAYEPLAAIGSGDPDTPEHANEVAEKLQDLAQEKVPVLYGGSVTAENVKSFCEMEAVSGALVGGASLDAGGWIDLVQKLH
jgi:triosephosphate isomerase (TIM)